MAQKRIEERLDVADHKNGSIKENVQKLLAIKHSLASLTEEMEHIATQVDLQ